MTYNYDTKGRSPVNGSSMTLEKMKNFTAMLDTQPIQAPVTYLGMNVLISPFIPPRYPNVDLPTAREKPWWMTDKGYAEHHAWLCEFFGSKASPVYCFGNTMMMSRYSYLELKKQTSVFGSLS